MNDGGGVKSIRILGFGLLALIILSSVGSCVAFEKVPVKTYGVRRNNLTSKIVEKDFMTGYHWGVTGVHHFVMVDASTHFLDFTPDPADEGRSIIIRTKDNANVTIDVTVAYKIIPGQAWKLVKDGLSSSYKERVRDKVLHVLREELSRMARKDFQETDIRLRTVKDAIPKLNKALQEYYVEAENIFIRQIRFSEALEESLTSEQLHQQLRLFYDWKAKEEKAKQETEGIVKKIGAEVLMSEENWEKKFQVHRSDYEVKIATILARTQVYESFHRADGDAEYEKLTATGQLAMDKVEADRTLWRNEVLNTKGGNIYVALQAAQNLRFGKVTLNSNDPNVPKILDISALTRLLIGKEKEKPDKE